MGFGKIFKKLWDKAPAPIKQNVAQAATMAKNVYKASEPAIKKFIADPKGTSIELYKQRKVITNQIVNKAVAIAKKNIPIIAKFANRKIEEAKQKAQKIQQQAAKIFNKAKSDAKQYFTSAKSKAKSAFNGIKKIFTPQNIVKKVIQICPVSSQGYGLAESSHKAWTAITSSESKKSKAISGASALVSASKNVYDAVSYYQVLKGATNPIKAITNSTVSGFWKWNGFPLDIAVGAVTGGLENLAKNIDRKDISKTNKAGRVAFGAAKGITNAGLAAGMGAATGAVIGGAVGFFAGGAGAVPGAVVGAKLGATFLTPLFEKPSEWITEKLFTKSREDWVGKFAEEAPAKIKYAVSKASAKVSSKVSKVSGKISTKVTKTASAVRGAWTGTLKLISRTR